MISTESSRHQLWDFDASLSSANVRQSTNINKFVNLSYAQKVHDQREVWVVT